MVVYGRNAMRPSFVCALVARMDRPPLGPRTGRPPLGSLVARTGRAPLAPDAYRVRPSFVCALVARSTPLGPRSGRAPLAPDVYRVRVFLRRLSTRLA